MEPKLTEFEEWCEVVLNNGGITYEPLTDEGARKIEEKWDNDMARLGKTNKYGIRRTSDGRGFEVYRKF
jgi:hypothetical protein